MRKLLYILILLPLCLLMVLPEHAKPSHKNPLGIDSLCYRMYRNAEGDTNLERRRKTGEQIILRARKLGDLRAEYYGKQIVINSANFFLADTAAYLQEILQWRNIARRTGDEQLIYDTYSPEVGFRLFHRQHIEAYSVVTGMLHRAQQRHSAEGLLYAYGFFADIYQYRGDKKKAREYAQKAVEILQQLPSNPAATHAYLALYNTSFEYSNPNNMQPKRYLDLALASAQSRVDSFQTYVMLALHHGRIRDRERYAYYYRQYHLVTSSKRREAFDNYYWRAESYRYIFDGKLDTAISVRSNIADPASRMQSMAYMATLNNNHELAYRYTDSMYRIRLQNVLLNDNYAMAHFNNMVERSNLVMESEKQQQAIEKARMADVQLQITQQLAEQEAIRNSIENERLREDSLRHADAMRLNDIKAKQQMADLQQRSFVQQHSQQEHEASQQRYLLLTLCIMVVIFLLILIFIFSWYRRIRKQLLHISRLRDEQQEAHDRALKLSQKKDEFIKNMSHEVRTPLNNVAGFAQLLTQSGSSLTDEERMEYGILIQQSSLELTEYINSILNTEAQQHGQTFVSDASDGIASGVGTGVSDGDKGHNASRLMSLLLAIALMACGILLPLGQQNSVRAAGDEYEPVSHVATSANTFGINDECFAAYTDLRKSVGKEDFNARYQRALALSQSKNDAKAQCLMHCINMIDAIQEGHEDRIVKDVSTLLDASKRMGYMRYYYYGQYSIAQYYAENYHVLKALEYISAMEREGNATNNVYARYFVALAYSDIYITRHDYQQALGYYEQALEICRDIESPQDLSVIYLNMYRCSKEIMASNADQKTFLDMSARTARADQELAKSHLELALWNAEQGDTVQFTRFFSLFEKSNQIYNLEETVDPVTLAKVRYNDLRFYSTPQKAHEYAASLSGEERFHVFRDYHLWQEDYRLARIYLDSMYLYSDPLHDRAVQIEYEELQSFYGNDSLRRQQFIRESELARLGSSQEESRMRAHLEQLRQQNLAAENERLSHNITSQDFDLRIKKAEMAERQAEIERQDARIRIKEQQNANDRISMINNLIMMLIGGFLLIMLLLTARIIHQGWMTKRMKNTIIDLRKARFEVQRASKMKDFFIQNMSHEIRTPLNAITGFAQLLALPEDTFPLEERQQFSKHIDQNIHLLTMLIDDILNLSNIEHGNYVMNIGSCNINKAIRSAMASVEYRVIPEVTMQFFPEVSEDFCLSSDSQRVQQVIINFLTNAIKHTQEGYITITNELFYDDEACQWLRISVSDTGEGIPKEEAQNIFERFVKLDSFVQGTGLGLNICRTLSQKLGGRCYCDVDYPEKRNAHCPATTHGASFVMELKCVSLCSAIHK